MLKLRVLRYVHSSQVQKLTPKGERDLKGKSFEDELEVLGQVHRR